MRAFGALPSSSQRRTAAALAVVCLITAPCFGQGTIAHVIADTNFGTFQGGTLPVDLNGDGVTDFTFVSTRRDFTVDTPSLSAVIAVPEGGLDLGTFVVPLDPGYMVGAQTSGGLIWSQTLKTQYGDVRPLLTSSMDVGSIGLFTGQNAYMGVRFQAADGVHYGWMRLDLPFVGVNGGYIREWAYDTRVNAPIFAGAVPEPSACALFGFGFLAWAILPSRPSSRSSLPSWRSPSRIWSRLNGRQRSGVCIGCNTEITLRPDRGNMPLAS
jgi:hypothetical protein